MQTAIPVEWLALAESRCGKQMLPGRLRSVNPAGAIMKHSSRFRLHRNCVATGLLVVLSACQTPRLPQVSQIFHPEKLAEMDAAISEGIAEKKLPGGVLWLECDGVVYHKAYGHRALVPSVEPMTELPLRIMLTILHFGKSSLILGISGWVSRVLMMKVGL